MWSSMLHGYTRISVIIIINKSSGLTLYHFNLVLLDFVNGDQTTEVYSMISLTYVK